MQVDKGRVLHEIMQRLKKIKNREGVLLQPYKKDRSICVVKQKNCYFVHERGFFHHDVVVEEKKIKKILKVMCRRECPRSNKIWLTMLTHDALLCCAKDHHFEVHSA